MNLGIVIATCIANLGLGFFVLTRNARAGYSWAFLSMSVLVCAWILGAFITEQNFGSSLVVNQVANRIAFIAGYGLLVSGLIFTYLFPVKRRVGRAEIWTIGLVSATIFALSTTSLISGEVSRQGDSLSFSLGPLLWLYAVAFVGIILLIMRNLLRLPKHIEKNHRYQARILLIAFSASAIIGLTTNVLMPVVSENWHTTAYGPLATVLLIAMIVYAIVRHGLFDVRLAVVRTSAYALSLLTLAGIYYVLALAISQFLLRDNSLIQPVGVALALVLAFVFQPVKRFFDQLTNHFFYSDAYNPDEFFSKLNATLGSTSDLHRLLERVSLVIAETLKAERAFFYIKHDSGHHHMTFGTKKSSTFPAEDVHLLDDYVAVHGATVIITDTLSPNDTIRRMLVSHRIALVLPLVKDGQAFAYLFLGEHLTSGYKSRDIRVLETLENELVIAIQNALSVQEIRDLNESLEHRIDVATRELRASNAQLQRLDEAKDEFMSMASHQLRTPLTSIKGYLSMVLEGDAGRVTPEQKHLLHEAFMSSDRMVRLIGDFLNVSRLQTGKFTLDKHAVNLADLVAHEIKDLRPTAATRNQTFIFHKPKYFPLLQVDESKLQQVVMNFCDNAIYYSKDNSTIKVSLKVVGDWAELTVKDSGIGVPAAQQQQLFRKFFRASNARQQRPDGTGVGLFLAKKVIDAHGGEIIFSSKEHRGSTFGFRLPLAKLAVQDAD